MELKLNARSLDLDIASADALWDFVAQAAAPVARRLAQLPGEARARVEGEIRALAREEARDTGTVTARYLEVVAEVPAV